MTSRLAPATARQMDQERRRWTSEEAQLEGMAFQARRHAAKAARAMILGGYLPSGSMRTAEIAPSLRLTLDEIRELELAESVAVHIDGPTEAA